MSKELSLKLEVKDLNINPNDKEKHSSEIVTTVCKNIIITWAQAKHGMSGAERKQFYAIQDAFDIAVKAKAESVTLEDKDMGMLRAAFREVVVTPDSVLRKVEDLVEAVRNK